MTGGARYRAFFLGSVSSSAAETVYELALPLLVVASLGGTPMEVSLVLAAEQTAWLALGLFVGTWVDRWSIGRVLMVTAIARCALIATIPIMALTGTLSFAAVLTIAAFLGVTSVFFATAQRSTMPLLIEGQVLIRANSRLEAATTAVAIAGQLGAGVVTRFFGAPIAFLLDATMSGVAGAAYSRLGRLRPVTHESDSAPRKRYFAAVAEGLRSTFGQASMRSLLIVGTLSNALVAAQYSLVFTYMTYELDMSAVVVSIVLTVMSVGSLVGALLNSRLSNRFGSGRMWLIAIAIVPLAAGLYPLTTGWPGAALLMVGACIQSILLVTVHVNAYSARQLFSPPDQLARVSSLFMFVSWGVIPLGLIMGGLLGSILGTRAALGVVAVSFLLPLGYALMTPLRRIASFEREHARLQSADFGRDGS